MLLPIFLASLAAYAFAWMPFPGRDWLFVAVFALQIVPLQVALIPLLDIYVNKLGFGASYWSVGCRTRSSRYHWRRSSSTTS